MTFLTGWLFSAKYYKYLEKLLSIWKNPIELGII